MLANVVISDASLTAMVTVVVAAIPVLGAVIISRQGTKRELKSIEVKVDGRLEGALTQLGIALTKVDSLEAKVAVLTGVPAPPTVAPGVITPDA